MSSVGIEHWTVWIVVTLKIEQLLIESFENAYVLEKVGAFVCVGVGYFLAQLVNAYLAAVVAYGYLGAAARRPFELVESAPLVHFHRDRGRLERLVQMPQVEAAATVHTRKQRRMDRRPGHVEHVVGTPTFECVQWFRALLWEIIKVN